MKTQLDKINFDSFIKDGLILVEIKASWCGFCNKQEPILDELEKISIGQLDGDENSEIAVKYGINGFPTFIVFKDGKEVDRAVGFKSKFELMDMLMKYLKD